MTKRHGQKDKTMFRKTLHSKLNIRQHKLHKGIKQKQQQQTQQKTDKNIQKTVVNIGAPEG